MTNRNQKSRQRTAICHFSLLICHLPNFPPRTLHLYGEIFAWGYAAPGLSVFICSFVHTKLATTLQRILTAFAGSHAHGILERKHKNLAVSDLARVRRFPDSLDDLLTLIIKNGYLDLDFGKEVDAVLRSAIALHLSLLATRTAHICDRHANDTYIRECLLHILQPVRPYNCKDQFHSFSSVLEGGATPAPSTGQKTRTLYAPAPEDVNSDDAQILQVLHISISEVTGSWEKTAVETLELSNWRIFPTVPAKPELQRGRLKPELRTSLEES